MCKDWGNCRESGKYIVTRQTSEDSKGLLQDSATMMKRWEGVAEAIVAICGIAIMHLEVVVPLWFLIANFDTPITINNATAGCMELLRQPAEYSGIVFEGGARVVECRKEEEGTGGGA